MPHLFFAAQTLQCPSTLRISSAVLQSPDVPAEARLGLDQRRPLRLSSIGVYSGHPRERAALVPRNEDEQQSGGTERWIWKFDVPDPHGIYAVCEYGAGVQVSWQVGETVRACTGRFAAPRCGQPIASRRSIAIKCLGQSAPARCHELRWHAHLQFPELVLTGRIP
ncbi:STY0301 family protein [Xanthomonas floridensis]|uniref:STY0301 family protein n=1 Tax=Xanthomonas floridensis TaxID=1843580 RepID=A0ABU5Q049_9XANT|nr:STY0301 family protein [Xanthomonas floridensis]MEA5125198.1 STY0301 family protein [Xanthomonas floridensis]MEA5132915.1 STY0301 family protein [Xanthomonas floridensis]